MAISEIDEISEVLNTVPLPPSDVPIAKRWYGLQRIGDEMVLADQKDINPVTQRPILPPPEVSAYLEGEGRFSSSKIPSELALVLLNQRQGTLNNDNVKDCGDALKRSTERLRALQEEKLQAIGEEADRMSTHSTWSILKNAATYLTSAASFVLGVGCIASGAGTAAGAFLIASGGLGLFNQVMGDTGGWEKLVSLFTEQAHTQQQIARYMECGMTLLAIGMGLFGLGAGYYLGSGALFAQTATRTENMVKAVTLSGSMMLGTTAFGKAAAERRVFDSQSKLTLLQKEVLDTKFTSELYSNQIREAVDDQQGFQKLAQECIDHMYA